MLGRANYFRPGPEIPAYEAVEAHVLKRMRQWLCREERVKSGKHRRLAEEGLWPVYGRARLMVLKCSFA